MYQALMLEARKKTKMWKMQALKLESLWSSSVFATGGDFAPMGTLDNSW